MYTQCPDCEIAFKVTADVLKQAAGKVRCGGCGSAFDALAYLSEDVPDQPVAQEVSAVLPELKPEIIDRSGGLPHSISAEQSAALLKTLDDLAGSDIRIEDTGVEWRVLDEQEAAAQAADDDDAGPDIVEASEAFEEVVDIASDELRFDDNTPIPDDFNPGVESSYVATPAAEFEAATFEAEVEEPAPEITLSEPDEWTDILDEFADLVEVVTASVEEEPGGKESNADQPLDMDSQFALQAEAMGIELSGINDLENDEADYEVELEEESIQLDLIVEQEGLIDEPIIESHTIENELTRLDDEQASADEVEKFVPPMSAEEQTVNMQIDQDLMALAIEDEGGFASTIIIAEKDTEKKAWEEETDIDGDDGDDGDDGEEELQEPDDNTGFETIIMEGEFVRTAPDSEKLAVDTAAAAELADQAWAKETGQVRQTVGRRYGVIAGVVVLVLLFGIQLIHQSRETLATLPAFSNTISQIYRAIGQPVQPAWDITGWRFEATKGNTEGEDEALTVYSRLGNDSDGPLPYPLIGISLTDRFEETIGSRVLDPAEYLPTDLDPRKLVEPGNTFNAVITIKSASEDATGFKLNVCYRLSNGQLRCAIDDFK